MTVLISSFLQVVKKFPKVHKGTEGKNAAAAVDTMNQGTNKGDMTIVDILISFTKNKASETLQQQVATL